MTKRARYWARAAAWALIMLAHIGLITYDGGNAIRWASVALYAGLALVWVGLARETKDK